MGKTLYWHDYETFGANPRRDRPAQFAGVRTDEALEVIGDPLMVYCKPAHDMLPHPEACLITGITPQHALANGLNEVEFIRLIHTELARPGTCGVGYNSLRFDDEVTRHSLYRNLLDPYAREWQNGNSRWDIIDMARMTSALRPEGIAWPDNEEGRPSFRLTDLTEANGISHESAHDALSDVYATIALARLIRERQPRLYDFVYGHRSKRWVIKQLNPFARKPMLHISGMYPAEHGRTAMVAPLAMHPTNNNGVIVYDLRHDPTPLLELSHNELRHRLFTPAAELPEGVERLHLKTVHTNRCPVIAPLKVMDTNAAERLQIDIDQGYRNLKRINEAKGVEEKLERLFSENGPTPESDPDYCLYGGGFFSNEDRKRMNELHRRSPEELAGYEPRFQDGRLPEMLFRFRARNWPETLSHEERVQWASFCHRRLTSPEGGAGITIDGYLEKIAELRGSPELPSEQLALLGELESWGETALESCNA